METRIRIPYDFEPRSYQLPMLREIDNGMKRVFCLWHRRAGKDLCLWNMVIKKAFEEVGLYYYMLPTYTQGKKIIWDGITNDGRKFLDYIPDVLVEGKNSTEMKIDLKNGSIIQIVGTDKYDSIRGTNPKGVVFSEYAYLNPMAWEVIRPILTINRGWACFNTTPNGKNHSYDMFNMAEESDDWFCERLSILNTNVLGEEDMELERKEGMSEEMIQQEYYCSFDIGTLGNYYAKQINDAQKENRICAVPHERAVLVDLYLDLGKNDSTTILFVQVIGKEVRVIDSYEANGEEISHYCQELNAKDYQYGKMYLPHDGFNRRLESNKTIAEQFQEAGFDVKRIPKAEINQGIQQLRKIFPRIWFDKTKCKQFIRALENYHKEWDEKAKVFRQAPKHDWSCFDGRTQVLTRQGTKRIMDLPEEGEILTPMGWQKYENPRVTGLNVPIVEVRFKDGTKVRCTQEHLFLTDKGWRSAGSLTNSSVILSSLTLSRSISMASSIGFGRAKSILLAEATGFIEWFGRLLLGKSQKAATLTTKTVIQEITLWKTLSACQQANTCQKHGKTTRSGEGRKDGLMKRLNRRLRSGTSQRQEGCGTREWQKERKAGRSGKWKKGIVSSVMKSLMHLLGRTDTLKSTATPTVRRLTIDGVKSLNEKVDVWDLTVPTAHLFSLENGAIVHNSHYADAARYMAIGLKEEVVTEDYSTVAIQFADSVPGVRKNEIGIPAKEYKDYAKAAKDLILKK
mgnify:FL=1